MCKLISSSTHFLKWVTRFCIFQIGYKATLLFGKRLQGLLDKCMVHATDMIFLKEGLGWIVAFIVLSDCAFQIFKYLPVTKNTCKQL